MGSMHMFAINSHLLAIRTHIVVVGNGILHTRNFGAASHVGVLFDMPSIGVGKTMFYIDGLT